MFSLEKRFYVINRIASKLNDLLAAYDVLCLLYEERNALSKELRDSLEGYFGYIEIYPTQEDDCERKLERKFSMINRVAYELNDLLMAYEVLCLFYEERNALSKELRDSVEAYFKSIDINPSQEDGCEGKEE